MGIARPSAGAVARLCPENIVVVGYVHLNRCDGHGQCETASKRRTTQGDRSTKWQRARGLTFHSTREKLILQYDPGLGGTVLVLFSEMAASGKALSTDQPLHGPELGSLILQPRTLAAVRRP